jgi:5'-methylthioadenosine phosphorylase
MSQQVIGILGGSGLYEMEGLTNVDEVFVTTPFGDPSDSYITGQYEGRKLLFLPRHGKGHRFSPSEVNYRANIHGFKQLGAQWLISISAVGSMRKEIEPGHVVIVDQLIDRTKNRDCTFFGDGVVGHIQFADPICAEMITLLARAAEEAGGTVHQGGTYVCMEGPQFSTRAESNLYRSWGVDVIGMTALPECKLAREAGLCYGTVAMSTDYDCWHEEEEDVSVDAILETLRRNVELARKIIKAAVVQIPAERSCGCKDAVKYAVITAPEAIPPETRQKLALILGEEG